MLDHKAACLVVTSASSIQSINVKEKLLSSKHDTKAVINLISVFLVHNLLIFLRKPLLPA